MSAFTVIVQVLVGPMGELPEPVMVTVWGKVLNFRTNLKMTLNGFPSRGASTETFSIKTPLVLSVPVTVALGLLSQNSACRQKSVLAQTLVGDGGQPPGALVVPGGALVLVSSANDAVGLCVTN